MRYKSYTARYELDEEAGLFHGRVLGIRDVVTFQGESVGELIQAFHDSVDDYLAFCAERGEEPQKPFSGNFMLRIPPELHRAASMEAEISDCSLNQWVADVIESRVKQIANSS
ncbi:MAG: type II toxin-antitoxin system HicB family antitoxin [Planctomycetaceae bacterium]|jgi:predicted HicB family RNase H-like nuclease|nr:type II toxin-antitoxin system HicB family antitoxin [bacterium]MDC0274425.1 type II toxin-antitoxin system HicB family antitoxin [Planctomycetaceae bacterium]MDG2390559.1 type II toxin-antitoxin system HicB family antitoxin [Planctomycetaceae bacterium]